MVGGEIIRRQPADLQLMGDVGGAERAGREAAEGIEDDEEDVEIVDQQIRSGLRSREEKEREGRSERQEGRQDIEPRAEPIEGQQRQQRGCRHGDQQDGAQRVVGERAHSWSPRKRSSAWTSMVSKRSRMRNRKMPITMNAMRIEKATLISTTSGMPLAPVAASTRPFSSDMKPTIWLTALRRVTIIKRPSSTTESANARSSRASGSASAVTRNITTIESATRPMPSSMAEPTPTTFSISR